MLDSCLKYCTVGMLAIINMVSQKINSSLQTTRSVVARIQSSGNYVQNHHDWQYKGCSCFHRDFGKLRAEKRAGWIGIRVNALMLLD